MTITIGDLVSSSEFEGIGKIVSVDEIAGEARVSFFESPVMVNSRIRTQKLTTLNTAPLGEEAVVYCVHPQHNIWCRVRYGGVRPNNEHLIIYRRGESDVVSIEDIYVLNLPFGQLPNPKDFLLSRSNDTPYYSDWRSRFISAYIGQRKACRSISSLLSSGVELEPHQLAVVRRVLQDQHKKYLLADEVGLGKTIEASMILRELLLQDPDFTAVVTVPDSLVEQWESELDERFFLGDLFDISLFVCSHSTVYEVLNEHNPDIFIVDEAHLIAPLAWSNNKSDKNIYSKIAQTAKDSYSCLLLSGTPLNGNEVNFLAMLHLISPDHYPLNDIGISDFKTKIKERERLGGIYQSLRETNDNATLEDNVELLVKMFPDDPKLSELAITLKPLIEDWFSDEDSPERTSAIKNIRKHLGETYRLHQRLLRNRREDPSVSALFPGLKGVASAKWQIREDSIAIDQYLDAYRSEHFDGNCPLNIITSSNFNDWLEFYLTAPMLLKEKLTTAGNSLINKVQPFESDASITLSEFAEFEQIQKDSLLVNVISSCLRDHEDSKFIVFCSEYAVAKHVAGILDDNFESIVELHSKTVTPSFSTSKKIKILVCDRDGEDGLNLHGGRKVIIHYSWPCSISRIEQRIGRVNRYSADIRAFPIQNIVLLPSSESLTQAWFELLRDGVGIFNESVASLQYVLEELIEGAWARVPLEGTDSLKYLTCELAGEDGVLNLEKQKVRTQEQLNSMEADIEAIEAFTAALIESDNDAQDCSQQMSDWITKGLQFNKLPGESLDTFRYQYHPGTLMDVKKFIRDCRLGLDFENSSFDSPVTGVMCFDRTRCSQGAKIYPFRYGQPFVDSIYKALSDDSRGICSAKVRILSKIKLQQPTAGFKLEWLVNHKRSKNSSTEQKIYDEVFPPQILKSWYFSNGKKIDNQSVIDLLEKDYEPYDKSSCEVYRDVNLRPDRWGAIERHFPQEQWASLVESVFQSALADLTASFPQSIRDELAFDCLSMSVIILSDSEGVS